MVDKLKIGPFQLNVLPVYGGLSLEVVQDCETEPLAMLLNHAVESVENGLEDAVARGAEGSDPLVYVSPAAGGDEGRAVSESWLARTGESLEASQLACVGMEGRKERLVISWNLLREGLDRFHALRAAWRPEPGPWLFVLPARSPFVTPEDHEVIQKLSAEAELIDKLDMDAEVGRESHELITRRRAFLSACREAGIFDVEHDQARDHWLDYWFAERLLALRRAVKQLRAWGLLSSAELPPEGPVCLDYVRHELWPPGEDGYEWACAGLKLLIPPPEGEQGMVLEHIGASTIRAWWRCDGDLPAILAMERG